MELINFSNIFISFLGLSHNKTHTPLRLHSYYLNSNTGKGHI